MAMVDEKGNSCIFRTVTNRWTEEMARAVTMACGGSVSVSLYAMEGKFMKEYGVRGIVTRSETLGSAIRKVKEVTDKTPEEAFLEIIPGLQALQGQDMRRAPGGAGRLQLRQGDAGGHRRL